MSDKDEFDISSDPYLNDLQRQKQEQQLPPSKRPPPPIMTVHQESPALPPPPNYNYRLIISNHEHD